MAGARTPETALADTLTAIASPPRLTLLRELRAPKALREIELRGESGETEAERTLARQTVRKHLDKLVEASIVLAHDAERSYGRTVEYVVNHQRLFSLAEEVRGLARLRPTTEPAGLTRVAGPAGQPRLQGPSLVLVKGLEEGTVFPLAAPAPPGGWIVGRRRGSHVTLDFDEYVSAENTVIEWDGTRHVARDLPSSRNGTLVNFAPLDKGGAQALAHGDILGVGRTLLVYRAA